MKRRFQHHGNYEQRCEAVITLRDGSPATCQRYKVSGSRWCAQHRAIVTRQMTEKAQTNLATAALFRALLSKETL